MLRPLSQLGSRIARLLGEPKCKENISNIRGIKDANDVFDAHPFSDILPYQAYDETYGLFVGKKSLGFVVEAVPLVGGEMATQKEILSLFEEVLEEEASIQCLLWADHRTSPFLQKWAAERDKTGDIFRALADQRARHLQNSSKTCTRVFRFILSYSIPLHPKEEAAQCTSLSEMRERILKTLSSLTYAFSWDVRDFLDAVGGLINFDWSPEVHNRQWNPYDTLADQLPTGGSLSVEPTHLRWDGDLPTSLKTFRVVDYPNAWSLQGMQQLIGDITRDSFRIQTPFYLHYGVHRPPQGKAEGSFKRRSTLIENQGKSGALRRLIPELVEELKECDHIRRSTKQGAQFVWTQFSVGLWAKPEELAREEQALKSLFRIHQFNLRSNDHIHLPIFLASLPMNWAEYIQDLKDLNVLKTTISPECGNLVPIQGEWMGTPTPGLLLQGRRGQLLNWNPFDNQAGNYNTVVVGRSGSGKSVFMQDLILSGLGTGAKVYVLEVGRSFEKTCSSLNGQHIEFSGETPICLNPFTRISPHDEEERLASFSMMKSVIAYMASPLQGTTDYENALIERAINHAWRTKQNQATITTIAQHLQEQQDPRAQTLATMLTPYCQEGIYAKYFEGENNIDFTSPMVLIELEELKEKKDLQSVVLQLFIMAITNQAFLGDRKTPFYICIDEAWDLLRGKQTGVFIETLARRLRKYYGSLVIGTQSVDDFFTTPGALAAFENSDWMCFLAQKKSSISRLSESGKVNMNASMRRSLESITTRHGEFSEVMICDADGNYSIARLILDPFSGLLYSTQAKEYAELKDLQNQGLTIVDAINHMLKKKRGGSYAKA